MNLQFIAQNKDGNYYVGFKIPVKRGIRGKTKGIVDELVIVGVHRDQFPKWCKEHNIEYKEI